MDRISYDLKITTDDIDSVKKLTKITKRYSLRREIMVMLGLLLISIILNLILYYLLFLFLLVILFLGGIKMYNFWLSKREHTSNKTILEKMYTDNGYQIILDQEKIAFGKTIRYHREIKEILEDEKIYLFVTSSSKPKNNTGFVVPKRDIDTLEFEKFISKTELHHLLLKKM